MNVNGRVYEKSSQSSPKNFKEPATIQPASSSTSHTNISSTTENTIFSIACITTTSHTHPHATDYLHHTNIKTSTTIDKIYHAISKQCFFMKKSLRIAAPVFCFFTFRFRLVFIIGILFVCGDIQLNLSPKNRNFCYIFLICRWNVNNIILHNFAKVNLLSTSNATYDFDMHFFQNPI